MTAMYDRLDAAPLWAYALAAFLLYHALGWLLEWVAAREIRRLIEENTPHINARAKARATTKRTPG